MLSQNEIEAAFHEIECAIRTSYDIMENFANIMIVLGMCWEGETYNSYLAAFNRYRETDFKQFELLMNADRNLFLQYL